MSGIIRFLSLTLEALVFWEACNCSSKVISCYLWINVQVFTLKKLQIQRKMEKASLTKTSPN